MSLLGLSAAPAVVPKPCAVVPRRACLSALALFAPAPAFAYGGGANLRQTDAGEGNPRYEALVETMRAAGSTPSRMKVEPVVERCRTGKEPACK